MQKEYFREYIPDIKSDNEYRSFIVAHIELHEFNDLCLKGNYNILVQFFEKLTSEIYHTRTRNYNWGYKVIEPDIFQQGSSFILSSRLFKEEKLDDLNSMIFRLFSDYCNLITASAVSLELSLTGGIAIGEMLSGKSMSHHPEMKANEKPLVMADLLKVFPLSKIFPDGMQGADIPAARLDYFIGEALANAEKTSREVDSVGIFMPWEYGQDLAAEVSILSDMFFELEIKGRKYYASNWTSWVNQNQEFFSLPDIVESAKVQSAQKDGQKWKHFLEYSGT